MQKMEGKQLVILIAVVTLAVIFVFFQYLPLAERTKELRAANVKLLTENTAASTRQQVLPQRYEEIERVKKQVGDFDAKIPVGRSHGLFLQDLTSVMQKLGLGELAVGPGTEVETDGLSRIPVSIRCKGGLMQIFKFFRALENFERTIQIEEVRLKADDKFDGSVTTQAKVNIFYRTD